MTPEQRADTTARTVASTYARLWAEIEPIGPEPSTGGYRRFAWSDADLELREWFAATAADRGLTVTEDGNGNQFAVRGELSDGDALLLGSHLDSVPDGGAYDGPLGVVSAFAALDGLAASGRTLRRPVVVANFADEEGARFGVACAGSRLLTGALEPGDALGLRDRDGLSLAEVLRARGRDPQSLGPAPEILDRIGEFVELHVEQGRGLARADVNPDGAAVAVGSAIWPHGRHRFHFTGRADHAGTTRMADRVDPMLTYAMTALAANKVARLRDEASGARATFGRLEVRPGGTNAIASAVTAWLDARAGDEQVLLDVVDAITRQATERADRDGTTVQVSAESLSGAVVFDAALRDDLAVLLGGAPVLDTAAGHDAGVLCAYGVPTAMLFVRNPTGVSHSPAEHADADDCVAGAVALARVVEHLAGS